MLQLDLKPRARLAKEELEGTRGTQEGPTSRDEFRAMNRRPCRDLVIIEPSLGAMYPVSSLDDEPTRRSVNTDEETPLQAGILTFVCAKSELPADLRDRDAIISRQYCVIIEIINGTTAVGLRSRVNQAPRPSLIRMLRLQRRDSAVRRRVRALAVA